MTEYLKNYKEAIVGGVGDNEQQAGNSTQYSVMTYMGKESKKRVDINIYMYN